MGEGRGAEVGVGTCFTGTGSVLFNDWITSHLSRIITQSFNIQDTELNLSKAEKKDFLKNEILFRKIGFDFLYQFINYRTIPSFIFPNCLTGKNLVRSCSLIQNGLLNSSSLSQLFNRRAKDSFKNFNRL